MPYILENRIKEVTASTGTGVLTLSGTLSGFRTFASKCVVGDTFRYTLQGVDATGVPTSEWEIGIGTYSAANQITRSVLDSSNEGAAVNLSAGTKHIWIGMDASMGRWIQERLTADRTYYVRADGSDANTGLASTSDTAFLTIQKAVDTVASLDMGKFQVIIQVSDGTYTGPVVLPKCRGDLIPIIRGNVTTPSNVHVNVTTAAAFQAGANTGAVTGILWYIQSLKISAAGQRGLSCIGDGNVLSFANIVFGVCANHMTAERFGKIIIRSGFYISGGASSHMSAIYGGSIVSVISEGIGGISGGKFLASVTITLAAYAFSGGLINVLDMSTYNLNGFTCTGKKYEISYGAIIITGNTVFPGGTAGTTANSGFYWS